MATKHTRKRKKNIKYLCAQIILIWFRLHIFSVHIFLKSETEKFEKYLKIKPKVKTTHN